MDYDTDSSDYGYDTYRDAWNGGVMDGADLLRRLADEAQQPVPGPCVAGEQQNETPETDGPRRSRTARFLDALTHSGPGYDLTPAETPEAGPGCAHCGKTIRLITGTLAEWWVHDPDGNTICVPELAASSPRATPKPNAEAPHTETPDAHSCGNCEGVDPDSCLTNLDRPAVKAQQAAVKTPDPAPDQWCKCPSCWGWFVEEHPGEDLDELGRDLGWWSGLPEHRDAPAVVAQPGKEPDTAEPPRVMQCTRAILSRPHEPHGWSPQPGMDPVDCPGHSFTGAPE